MGTHWGITWGERRSAEVRGRSSKSKTYAWIQAKVTELAEGGELPSTKISVYSRTAVGGYWELYEVVDLQAMADALKSEKPTQLPVGTVLTADSPEPPNDTILMMADASWEPYDAKMHAGRWRRFAERSGPFVVGPDVDKLLRDAGQES